MNDDKQRQQPAVPIDAAGLDEARLIQFRVSVGHEQFVVRGADRADALREARRRLCLELPRMWDVIEGLDDSRFEITKIEKAEEEAQ